jgi:hypothetical protein
VETVMGNNFEGVLDTLQVIYIYIYISKNYPTKVQRLIEMLHMLEVRSFMHRLAFPASVRAESEGKS